MKKYPKVIQTDNRGQIVIPKDIRRELGIDEGTGFWVYSLSDEGILLKKIDAPDLDSDENKAVLTELEEKADKIEVASDNLNKSKERYKRTTKGNLEVL